MFKNIKITLIGIFILALFLRIFHFSSPFFTSEEARVASRGFIISTTGHDELGRFFPVLFNSLIDYQLPIESYLVALSEFIFRKTDFGVRLPFIILGSILPLLVYKITQRVTGQNRVGVIAALLIAISPSLIFISKIPNQTIILLNIYSLLFYLIISKKINKFVFALICLLLIFTSKITWFITVPFIFASFYYSNELASFKKWPFFSQRGQLGLISIVLIVLSFIIFLKIPQGKRSIIENNFSFFSDISLINGINQLRGQGLDLGINPFLERILFNKLHILFSGFLNWISQLSIESLFGNLSNLPFAVFINILIIPFLIGIVVFLKNNKKLLIYPLVFTFPAFFMHMGKYRELILLTVPFISIIIAVGVSKLNDKIICLILLVIFIQFYISTSMTSFDKKISNSNRPSWLKEIILDATAEEDKQIAISDNIIKEDITPYIQWFTTFNTGNFSEKIDYPYKFKRYSLDKLTLLPSEQKFTSCREITNNAFFLSKRDLNKSKELNLKLEKTYQDNLNNDVVFKVSNICLE